jgi:hypothetical protein
VPIYNFVPHRLFCLGGWTLVGFRLDRGRYAGYHYWVRLLFSCPRICCGGTASQYVGCLLAPAASLRALLIYTLQHYSFHAYLSSPSSHAAISTILRHLPPSGFPLPLHGSYLFLCLLCLELPAHAILRRMHVRSGCNIFVTSACLFLLHGLYLLCCSVSFTLRETVLFLFPAVVLPPAACCCSALQSTYGYGCLFPRSSFCLCFLRLRERIRFTSLPSACTAVNAFTCAWCR